MTRVFASVSFGLLCLLALWWVYGPLAWMPLWVMVLLGAIAGVMFHWALNAWLAWIERPVTDADEDWLG